MWALINDATLARINGVGIMENRIGLSALTLVLADGTDMVFRFRLDDGLASVKFLTDDEALAWAKEQIAVHGE